MSYMKCSRCGVSVRMRAAYLALERCPRCLARAGVSVPMEIFERPSVRPLLKAIPLADQRLGHERSA